jgi:MSHA pilin protein MshC
MKQHGFTLVELIMVLMVVGILAVYVTASTNNVSMTSYSGAEELVQAIRYAQQEAMDHTGVSGIGISIQADGFTFIGVTSPVDTWQLLKNPTANYAVAIAPTGTIIFDGRGTPTCAGGLNCNAASQTITVTADGINTALTIEPFTGLAHR